jgi:hypothetical protein
LGSAQINLPKNNTERILQGLESLPESVYDPRGFMVTDFQLMREIAEENDSNKALYNDFLPKNLKDDDQFDPSGSPSDEEIEQYKDLESLNVDKVETVTTGGLSAKIIKYDDPDDDIIREKYLDELEKVAEYSEIDLNKTPFNNIVFHDSEYQVSVVTIAGDEEEKVWTAEKIIDTLRGDEKNMRGETGRPEGFRGHETFPGWVDNPVVTENTVMSIHIGPNPPKHSNLDRQKAISSEAIGTIQTYEGNNNAVDAFYKRERTYNRLEREAVDIVRNWNGGY